MATKVNVYKKDLGHHMSDIFVDIVTETTSEISYQQVAVTGLPEEKRAILHEAFPVNHPIWKTLFPNKDTIQQADCDFVIATGRNHPSDRTSKLRSLIDAFNEGGAKVEHKLYRYDEDLDRLFPVREESRVAKFLHDLESKKDQLEFLGESKEALKPAAILAFVNECLAAAKGTYVVVYCPNCKEYKTLLMKNRLAKCPVCHQSFIEGQIPGGIKFSGASYFDASKKAAECNRNAAKEIEPTPGDTFYFQKQNYSVRRFHELFDALYINLSTGKDVVFTIDEYGNLAFDPTFLSYVRQISEPGFEFPESEVNYDINSNDFDKTDAMYDLFVDKGLLTKQIAKIYKGKIRTEYHGRIFEIASLHEYLVHFRQAVMNDNQELIRFYLSLVKEPYVSSFFQSRVNSYSKYTDIARIFYEELHEFLYIQSTSDSLRVLYAPSFDAMLEKALDPKCVDDVFNFYSDIVVGNEDLFPNIPSYPGMGSSDPYYFLMVLRSEYLKDGSFIYEHFVTEESRAKQDVIRLLTLRYRVQAKIAEETPELQSFWKFIRAAKRAKDSASGVNPAWIEPFLKLDFEDDHDGFDTYLRIHNEWDINQVPVVIGGVERTFLEHFKAAVRSKDPFPFLGVAAPMLQRAFIDKDRDYGTVRAKAEKEFDDIVSAIQDIESKRKRLGF
ncbi:MAG: hypothetical protein SPL80_01160 [Bacilli bacterium]|nr:hypothetical protein [Bacilli bacterium]